MIVGVISTLNLQVGLGASVKGWNPGPVQWSLALVYKDPKYRPMFCSVYTGYGYIPRHPNQGPILGSLDYGV